MAGEYTEADIDAFLAGGEPTGEPTTSGEYTEADIDAFLAGGEPTGSEEYNEADIDAFLGVEPDQNESDLPPFVDPPATERAARTSPSAIFGDVVDSLRSRDMGKDLRSAAEATTQYATDTGRGVESLLTWGQAPKLEGAIHAAGALVPGGESPREAYDRVYAQRTAMDEESAERNPGAFYGPEVAAMATGAPAVIKAVGTGAKYLAGKAGNRALKKMNKTWDTALKNVDEATDGKVMNQIEKGGAENATNPLDKMEVLSKKMFKKVEAEQAAITTRAVPAKSMIGAGYGIMKEIGGGIKRGQGVSPSTLFQVINNKVDPLTAGLAGAGYMADGLRGAAGGWMLGAGTSRLMMPKSVAQWRSAERSLSREQNLERLNQLTQKAQSLYTPEGNVLGLMGGANLLLDEER